MKQMFLDGLRFPVLKPQESTTNLTAPSRANIRLVTTGQKPTRSDGMKTRQEQMEEEAEQARRDEKNGVYPQHEDVAN